MKLIDILKMLRTRLLRKEAAMLKPGDQAPAFSSVDHHGNPIRLEDFRGRNVVLWFFPMADTPG